MKTTMMMFGAIALTLAGTGCATKKYVTQSLQPVESRVTAIEGKDTDQDKTLASQGKEIEDISTDLSRSKERLSADISAADSKATQAGQAAQQAGTRADAAQQSANGASTLAQQGIDRENRLEKTVDGMNKYKMSKSVTVLFPVNEWKLNDDAKAQLDEIANATNGQERFVIEVQGFTDKTGTPTINERLSQERAESAARYLVNEHMIPVRSVNTLGSGYAMPVADDKTRDGRKQNRRVEIRVFVPEVSSVEQVTAQNN